MGSSNSSERTERQPLRPLGVSDLPRLPVAMTTLIGRDRELGLAKGLLRRPNLRLLTITGPGGIGKTRLALQLAANVAGDYANGVVFVSLASVRSADLVAKTIAQAAGVPESGAQRAIEALISTFRDQNALLVLDNFEHLLDATNVVTDLLNASPRVRVVVTSRVLLRVDGEHTIPVPPLSLPEGREEAELANAQNAESVRLFIDRAQSVSPSFTLDESTAPMVAEICRRVDGLPLAIELAASRIRHLPLPILLERLGNRLPILTGGSRDQPTRLQTMRNAIAWSHDLLEEPERRLFRRLARFVDGFTLEAAEFVATEVQSALSATDSAESVKALPTIDGLGLLIDKSLVQVTGGHRKSRYFMLETIREFAEEMLAAAAEIDVVGDAHAAWCQVLADRSSLALFLPDGERLLQHLESDHANLQVALAWLDQREASAALVRLVAALSDFWYSHSHYWEGRTWFERALSNGGPGEEDARILIGFGRLLSFQGDVARADSLLSRGIEFAAGRGDSVTMAAGLLRRGWNRGRDGFLDEAEAMFNAARHEATRISDPDIAAAITGMAMANLGLVERWRGDLDAARAWHEQSLGISRIHGYTLGVVRSLSDLGSVARDAGDYVGALAAFQECLALIGNRGDFRVAGDVIEGAGIIAVMWGEPERAARLLGAGQALRDQFGITIDDPIDHLASERATLAARAALGDRAFETALLAGRTLSMARVRAEVETLAPPAGRVPDRQGPFSRREWEVLERLVAGQTNVAIAAELFISSRTVENHVAHIFAKLGVSTRAAAVSAAIGGGHVSLPQPRDLMNNRA